jgi:murein DD-endopeptidase MepM/ murein hydrolase activator NlpD
MSACRLPVATARFFFISIFLALALPAFALAALPKAANVPGGIALVDLGSSSAHVKPPRAWFAERPVLVTGDRGRWVAVVGLALDLAPGVQELRVVSNEQTTRHRIEVRAKHYPEQRITLKDKGKVQLSDADLLRVERELAAIRRLKIHWRASSDTSLDFSLPVVGRPAGRVNTFGLRRFFNGEPRAPHAGFDIAVARGTPIKASAPGVVLAVDDYFFNGKTVFVDHGNGLISMVCHLDRIDVATGESVNRGQRVGLSGMTGRATGPHLHWSVVLNGAMVDPQLFVSGH